MAAALASAAEPPAPPSIRVLETWSNVFGGREAVLHAAVTPDVQGRLGWRLSAFSRSVLSGDIALPAARGEAAAAEIRFTPPAAKPGVIVAMDLELTLSDESGKSLATSTKRLWVFPEDPFFDRTEWLASLGLRLFDPAGMTAAVLESNQVPFEAVNNVDALAALQAGLLLVGEGVSLAEHRGLDQALAAAAGRGVRVLGLAPADGELALPGLGPGEAPAPSSISLRRADLIRELDKRLDAEAWPPSGSVAAGTWVLTPKRETIAAAFQPGAAGWPWIEIRYAASRGALVLCAFPVIAGWEASPAPRFLFVQMLERLSDPKPDRPKP